MKTAQRVCPRCGTKNDLRESCANCGQRLDAARPFDQLPAELDAPRPARPGVRWVERVAAGVMVAQGVYLGGRLLMFALGGTPDGVAGRLTLHGLQALGVLLATLACCGGHQRGVLLGGLTGLLNSILLLIGSRVIEGPLAYDAQLDLPPVQIFAGLLGAAISCRVWRPFPEVPVFEESGEFVPPDLPKPAGPPAQPGRALLGAAAAALGVLWADQIASLLAEPGAAGALASFFASEMAALLAALGGAWAGANTGCGLKQGIIAGLLAGLAVPGLVLGLHLEDQFRAYDFLYGQFGVALPGSGASFRDLLIVAGGGTLICVALGGWLGGQLMPPLASRTRLPTHGD